jgi:hypothetical protein
MKAHQQGKDFIEWDGWDDNGFANTMPDRGGIDVVAFINSDMNGVSGPMGKWVRAKTVCGYSSSNGGVGVIVNFDGRNYEIGATTHLKRPESIYRPELVDSPEDIPLRHEDILCWDGCQWHIDYVDIDVDTGCQFMANGTEVRAYMPLPINPTGDIEE